MNFDGEYSNFVMESFEFESGRTLDNVNVEYWVNGTPKYDDEGNIVNAVVYCPTLKGRNSILVKSHDIIYDAFFADYFFIKITALGAPNSCSPSSTGLKYDFPHYTVKDRVNFKRQFLEEKFNIKKVAGIIGEGVGGFEVYTWACEYPKDVKFIIVLNTTFKTYGYRYVMLNAADAIIDSSDDFYGEGYSVSISKLIVAISRLLFVGYFPKKVFEELSNAEIDVLMGDYVDESLFMDIHDFKSRNDCLLQYDVSDKLENIEAKALIIGLSDYFFFNDEKDILPLKDLIKDSKIVLFKEKESFYDDDDYSDIGLEIISFLKQFE
ncbi:hypothetical protein [uncultured Methanobrevibacter sp.]|uniref:hypothetical protein n=1 Tax=uncultured Methanobrevibacter sp. TaxID=253161 RepID=UPI0025FE0551|nr:hypothetical protein [uncultured Methanobrevibacter sp.]